MFKLTPVAFAYLDHDGNVCYTGNMEGPRHELETMSRYGRKGAMLALITEKQHQAANVILLNNLKNLLDNPDQLKEAIEKNLQENMR